MTDKTKDDIKKGIVNRFIHDDRGALNTFRTLILFGQNTATYKFAFCDALLKQSANSQITYQDLLSDMVTSMYEHHKTCPFQFNGKENNFTRAMDIYNSAGETQAGWNDLLQTAEGIVFNHVLRAFQNVGGGTIGDEFKLYEHLKSEKKIVFTDNALKILELPETKNIIRQENASRWGIVESSWAGGISTNLMEFNSDSGEFYSIKQDRRVNLRSAVSVLSPYQKGKCFYCRRPLDGSLHHDEDAFPDVDHFFALKSLREGRKYNLLKDKKINVNGIWNLVLACKACNRGEAGKFEQKADDMFYEKLLNRNLYFLEEHRHTVKEGVCTSLNVSNSVELRVKMKEIFDFLEVRKGWKPKDMFD